MFPELTQEQLSALAEAPRPERLPKLAGYLGVSLDTALERVSEASRIPVLGLRRFDTNVVQRLPGRIFTDFHAAPVEAAEAGAETGPILLATPWPPEEHFEDWVIAVCGREVSWVLSLPDPVTSFLTTNFGVGFSSLDTGDAPSFVEEEEEEIPEDGDAAVIRFVNDLIQQAIADEATDIHLEPQEKTLRIRYRIDGILVQVPMPENLRAFQEAIISRLKIMAHLNISEKRLPQDGRINFKVGESVVDIRISTIPTLYAESVSLRLLNNKREPLTLSQLGMNAKQQELIDKVLAYPHGIILATGPTGSGKSTSLNSFICRINSSDRRIITIEDPVEYEVPGVNQMQVRPEIGLDFASGLRHILRQDPDVIMVGEIRDRETADIAIRASLTGHLVFSTLHTNDSAGAITRLVDMGIEPFLVASAVELIIAQRLVRRLCQHCKSPQPYSQVRLTDQLHTLEVDDIDAELQRVVLLRGRSPSGEPLLMGPVGCQRCRGLGYRGRVGIYEILRVDESLHDLIIKRESTRAIMQVARKHGTRTLSQSGWEAVLEGLTTVDEIVSATAMET
jgi:type II secretory ATPase GspE/PulE/Tfp pilus assembly ATPase PilB-like protein